MAKDAAYGSLTLYVNVNDAKAQTSLNTLKTNIRSMGAEWKANATEMKAAGDSMGALETKIGGLNRQIAAQEQYNKGLEHALEGTVRGTDTSALAYDRWEAKLNQGKASMARMEAQLQSSNAVFQRSSTGIEELQRINKAWNDSMDSSVSALKAEGRETEANAEKKKALEVRTEGLLEELVKEEHALDNIEKAEGSSTVEIEKQNTKVNQAREAYAKAAKEQKEYTSGLHDLKTAQSSINTATDGVITRLKGQGKEFQSQALEAKKLGAIQKNLAEQYKIESKELSNIESKTGKATQAYAEQMGKVTKLTTDMDSNNKRIKEINKNLGGMGTAGGKARDGLNKMASAASKFQGTANTISRGAVVAGVGIATIVGQGLKLDASLTTSYTKTQNLIKTSNTESTSEISKNMATMRSNTTKYSNEYGISQQKIADGYQELIKRGYSSAQALGAYKSVMQAAVASGDDLNDVTTVVTQTLESFGMKTDSVSGMIKNTSIVTNEMAYAADMTATDFQSLGKGMEYVGNTAHQAGFSLSETAGAMGILSNNGLEADKAGTGLRKAINSLVTPTDNATGALKSIGLTTKDFTDKSGNMKSMSDIFKTLGDHMKGLTGQKRTDIFHAIFGTTGQQAGGILVDNASALKGLNAQIQEASANNYIDKLSKANLKTPINQFNILKENVKNFGGELANDLLPTIVTVGNEALKFVKGLDSWWNKMSKSQQLNVAKWTAVGVAAVALIGPVTKIMSLAGGAVKLLGGIPRLISFVGNRFKTSGTVATVAIKEQTAMVQQLTAAWTEAATAAEGESIASGGSHATGVGTRRTKGSKVGTTAAKTAESSVVQEGEEVAVGAASKTGILSKASSFFTKSAVASRAVSGLKIGAVGTALTVGMEVVPKLASGKKIDWAKQLKSSILDVGAGAIGGAVGGAVGGPIGAAIGAVVVPMVADKLKTAFVDKDFTAHVKVSKISTSVKTDGLSEAVSKKIQPVLKDLSKHASIKISADTTALGKSRKNVEKDSKAITAVIKGEQAKQITSAKKYLDSQLKDGTITRAEYNKQLKAVKNRYNTEVSTATKSAKDLTKAQNSYYKRQTKIASGGTTQLQNIAKKYGKNSTQYENEKNKEMRKSYQSYIKRYLSDMSGSETKVAAAVKKGGDKQKDLRADLNKNLGKYNKSQLNDQQKKSNEIYNAAVKPAKKQRDSVINAAETTYQKAKKAAQHQRDDTGSITNDQYKKIVAKAKQQRDDTSKAADNQYKKVTKSATNQHDETTKTIKAQKDTITRYMNGQSKNAVAAAEKQKKDVTNKTIDQMDNQMTLSDRLGRGLNKVWGGISGFFSGMFKNLSKGSGKVTTYTANGGISTSGMKYAGGPISQDQMALVGEEGPEARINKSTGRMDILGQNGTTMAQLRAGDHILNAHDTASLFTGGMGRTIPGFAKGTTDLTHFGTYADGNTNLSGFLSGFITSTPKFISGLVDSATKIAKAIGDPVKKIASVIIEKFDPDTVVGKTSLNGKGYATGIKGVAAGAVKNLKELISSVNDNADVGSAGEPSGSGVQRWKGLVRKGLAANNLSTSASMIARVLRQISTESGGNPKAKQPGADPDGDGSGPAMGLMQTKRATFNANAFSGHKNIYNGFDSILAGLHYAKRTYGSGLGFLGQGHGYANGGLVNQNQMIEIAEQNKPEMVIPLTNKNRSVALLKQSVDYLANNDGSTQAVAQTATGDSSAVAQATITQLTAMVEAQQQTLAALNTFIQMFAGTAFTDTDLNAYKKNLRGQSIYNNQQSITKGTGLANA